MTSKVRKIGVAVGVGFSLLAACKKEEKATPKAPTVSAITVQANGNAIRIQTSKAEFLLGPTGNLQGAIRDGSSNPTLAENGPGIEAKTVTGVVPDITRDLAHAKIENATGKLGELGKRVTIQGRSARQLPCSCSGFSELQELR
jgi:hypothetical protein